MVNTVVSRCAEGGTPVAGLCWLNALRLSLALLDIGVYSAQFTPEAIGPMIIQI